MSIRAKVVRHGLISGAVLAIATILPTARSGPPQHDLDRFESIGDPSMIRLVANRSNPAMGTSALSTGERFRYFPPMESEVVRVVRFQGLTDDADALGAGDPTGPGDGAAPPMADAINNVSGNPAAVNIFAGTGRLGELLGVNRNGIRVGGLTIFDENGILSGGLGPGKWAGDSLTIGDLTIDFEEMFGWKGALFGTQFLYYYGFGPGYTIAGIEQGKNSANSLAGTVMGFNSLGGLPPHSRAELYQLWFRQELFDKKLVVRLGKSVPTVDFNNVSRAVPMSDDTLNIPAVTSVIFTPIFVSPTMLGTIPGYYNSATGLTATYLPNENVYFQYGLYDGNLARGRQLGLEGPHFNGYYFHIGEIGLNWTIGPERCPGQLGVGYWGQTGELKGFDGSHVDGAQGVYFFGSQRLYFEQPGVNSQGLTSYVQFGSTNAPIIFTQRYFGCGLTYFGPIPGRDDDSAGFGLAQGWMTDDPNAAAPFFRVPEGTSLRSNELGNAETILSWYYQMNLGNGKFFQPNLTYIPDPARHEGIPSAFALTLRMIVLF